jgi:hypothetical protein
MPEAGAAASYGSGPAHRRFAGFGFDGVGDVRRELVQLDAI